MQIFKHANYDFIRWRWHALVLSSAVIVGGFLLMLARGGMPLGIDFTGGTIVVVRFEQKVPEDVVRKALDVLPGEKVVQQYGDAALNEVLIRFPQAQGEEQGFGLEANSRKALDHDVAMALGLYYIHVAIERLLGVRLEAEALLLALRLREPDEDLVLRRLAVLLHDLLAGQHVERLPDGVVRHPLVELHHDDRAAGEVDAERHAAADEHQQEAADDDDRREHEGVPPPADEIVVRVLEDLHTSPWRRLRCSGSATCVRRARARTAHARRTPT